MKKRLFWMLMAGTVLMMSTTSWVSAESRDPGDGAFTKADKAFYLTEEEVAFIRPGLVLEILEVVIPADLQPEVTFSITDPEGLPLDREGIFTPGAVSTSWILSYIPAGEAAYVAYTTRVQTSPDTGDSATQASSDSGGTYTTIEMGVYKYKFATVLPADYDMNVTHTLGVYARRDLREWDLGRQVVNELDSFIPSGNGVAEPRSYVTTATCNRCHDPLAIHGGARQEVGLCILCHNPTQSIDPDTGDSVDMPYMVHKIHYGENLTNGYTIIGYRQSVHDYSHVVFPTDPNDCQVCHTGGVPTEGLPMVANPNPTPVCDGSGLGMTEMSWGDEGNVEVHVDSADGPLFASSGSAGSQETGKWVRDGQYFVLVDTDSSEVLQEIQVDTTGLGCTTNQPGTFRGEAATHHEVWATLPTRWVCGSCHDDIDFAEGVGHLPQENDDNCSACHQPFTGEEFDPSVIGAHTIEYKSDQLGGFIVEILNIENTDPGDRPKVTFAMRDKDGPLFPGDLNRLRFSLSGPNTDFTFYEQETATDDLTKFGDNWQYRFDAKLPTDAMSSFTLGVEGRLDAVLNEGTDDEIETEDQMQNFVEPFAVTDDMAVSRRAVVDDAKCENCHSNVSLHGSNRHNANDYCQTCHMPSATDAAVRPADEFPAQSVDFRYMIHKIHASAELETCYTVYGYRSSFHDEWCEMEEFVGDLRNCETCHVDGSYQLPLNDGLEPVTTPRDYWSPMLPETASCLSCHDSESAAVHADSNTTDLGEACATCHGVGKTYSVDEVHAR